MKTAEIKAMTADLAPVIREFTAAALAPLASRLDALEKQFASMPAPKEVPDFSLIERAFKAELTADIAALRADIKAMVPEVDAHDLEAVQSDIAALRKAVTDLPKPEKIDTDALVERARDGLDADLAILRAAIDAIPTPEPLPDVKALVADAVAALPKPADGNSVTVDELRPVVDEAVAKAVGKLPKATDGEPGKPGVGVAGGMIDRDGCLVLTLSDGKVEHLGTVVGASVDEKQVAALVDAAVAKAVAAIPPAEPGKPGKSVTVDDVAPMIRELVAEAVAGIPAAVAKEVAAIEMKAADAEALAAVEAKVAEFAASIPAAVEAAAAALPKPENGKDADPIETKRMIDEAVAAAVAALPEPPAGKDADPEQVAALVKSEAERILAGWERPKNGESVTVDDVRPIIEEAVGKAVAGIPVPKDGVSLAGALIDRDGNLVLTLSNGETKELGKVVGKDGDSADMVALERVAREMIAAIPAPKDGDDGLGFDDLDLVESDDGMLIRFAKGDNVKDFLLPVVLDRGVWKVGDTYHRGAGVTFDGSFWISQQDRNTDKPGTSKAWRLAVRKGKDRNDPVKIDG